MQIDLVKYLKLTTSEFKKELSDLFNTKIPEGYIEVNAKNDTKKKTKV